MKGFAHSLLARNLVVMVGLLLASQLANWMIFRAVVQKPRQERLASYVSREADALRLALTNAPSPAAREAYLTAFNGLHPDAPVRIGRATTPPADLHPLGPRGRVLLGPLADRLGPDYTVYLSDDGRRTLWIRTRFGDEDFWLLFSADGLTPSLGTLLVAGSLTSLALALIGAWLIQRRIQRPLAELGEAARRVGRGEAPPPPDPAAPREIAAVAHSLGRMAEDLARAERERALMLAGVSHDLRTPLAKVRLCVELLPPDCDPSLVESMRRGIAAADGVITQFMDFARPGDDEALVPCDPGEICRSAVTDMVPDARIDYRLADLPPCLLRPLALRRLVANLVENARRHGRTPEGESPITLELVGQPLGAHPPESLSIAILDRGPGIPEAAMQRLRLPFARLDSARGGEPGAGLGLALVERIAQLHQGRLELENRPGGGLIARVVLPWRAP